MPNLDTIRELLTQILRCFAAAEGARMELVRHALDAHWQEKEQEHQARRAVERGNLAIFLVDNTSNAHYHDAFADFASRQHDMAKRLWEENATSHKREGWAQERGEGSGAWHNTHQAAFADQRAELIRLLDQLSAEIILQSNDNLEVFTGVNARLFRLLRNDSQPFSGLMREMTWHVEHLLSSERSSSAQSALAYVAKARLVVKDYTSAFPLDEFYAAQQDTPATTMWDALVSQLASPLTTASPDSESMWNRAVEFFNDAREHTAQGNAEKATHSLERVIASVGTDLKIPDLSEQDRQQPLATALDKVEENINRATGWFNTVEYDTSEVEVADAQRKYAMQEQGEVAKRVAATYIVERQEWGQTRKTHERYHDNHHGLTVAWARRAIALLKQQPSEQPSE